MSINGISGIFAAGNIVARASGGKGLRLWKDQGYYPSQWGHSKNAEKEKVNIGGLFFDAIFTTTTEHQLMITQHPVQTGANISDHAYVQPVKITMDIGVSDAMAYRIPGAYDNLGPTKSISAYRALCKMMELRIPVKVLTRLNTYENMLIESIVVNDDVSTLYALKATVQLVQILVVNVGTEKASAREWTTDTEKQAKDVPPQEVRDTSNLAEIKDDAGYYNPDKGGKLP